ncbi:MAG: ATPase domain-containing protein, partial [Luteimonas sp.]
GNHDYIIETGGLRVFPRLIAAHARQEGENALASTDLPELDALLGGGLDRGTSTLLIGAAGAGKSSLATHVILAAADRGERSAVFLFDESERALLTRSRGLGFNLDQRMDEGLVQIHPLDPAEVSPGEFVDRIRRAVEEDGVQVVVIDSLNGYMNAMPEERFLLIQLHELLSYLGQLGVMTLLINAQQGLIGPMSSTVDVSYLADTVILLRYYETRGEVRQALSVLKKRTGAHERTIRELRIRSGGLQIGEPLHYLRGVLTGVPQEEHAPAMMSTSE